MPLLDDEPRSIIKDLVARVLPYDRQEADDQAEILRWVGSGAPLFRVRSLAVPPRHLAVYFALLTSSQAPQTDRLTRQPDHFPCNRGGQRSGQGTLLDEDRRTLMLVDHIKAGCWLLPGGHVDDGEDPCQTVVREAAEELGIIARFHARLGGGEPFFLTVTQTRGAHSHTDVTLWFVLAADAGEAMRPDPRECRGVGWFGLDEPIRWDTASFDPQMHRFIAKLSTALDGVHLASGAPLPRSS
ncbi:MULTISPECIES: NUDIX domain-containing protein [unclassified Frankia]|uniref:NUDIX domain-containing protein n=1 Tax=unclassified Frankia TaxID=2632575 RepID=UPI001EF4FD7D|nr:MULTISPECIES: NUDIX domain-containing protein [unclassified Frankia]